MPQGGAISLGAPSLWICRPHLSASFSAGKIREIASMLVATAMLGGAPAAPHVGFRGIRSSRIVAGMPNSELQERLDGVPCFVVVDESRRPPPGMESDYSIYVDAEQARAELLDAQARFPDLGLRLVAVGAGFALERPAATLVSRAADVERARYLPGGDAIDWDGTSASWTESATGNGSPSVPLFGSFGLQQRDPEGIRELVTPLFLSCADAELVLAQAEQASGQSAGALRATSLQEMARMMTSGELSDPGKIRFVPPSASVGLVKELDALAALEEEDYAEGDPGMAGELRAAAEAKKAAAQRALTVLFDGDRSSRGAMDAGLFPE